MDFAQDATARLAGETTGAGGRKHAPLCGNNPRASVTLDLLDEAKHPYCMNAIVENRNAFLVAQADETSGFAERVRECRKPSCNQHVARLVIDH